MSAPSDLVIDLGHSRIKWARAGDGALNLQSVAACPTDQNQTLIELIRQDKPERVIWSPQGRDDIQNKLQHQLQSLGVSCRTVTTGSLDLPVAPAYSSLGSDRWLALQWPWQESGRALCVIDCGSAVTVDAVDGDGLHRGGWILAGRPALSKGLAEQAPQLPVVDADIASLQAPATDSARAIRGGFALQLVGGIERALLQLRSVLGERFDCWLTGGDAPAIRDALAMEVIHDPHLVLRGLAMAGKDS
ncbi:MAG: type III pantothenate kinase [Pseudomonadota bacterium]